MTTTKSAPTTGSDRILNFSAGPSTLPESVLRQAQQDLWNIDGSGIGILEHSHRGKVFDRVIDEAVADCRTVAGISDDYTILFLQGGASLQFGMIPLNFLTAGRTADYADTGVWAKKAMKEAQKIGSVHCAFDGSASGYDHTPDGTETTCTPDAAYFHYCTNNTIYGTQYPAPPTTDAPLIADMSSDIFSRPIDVDAHAMIYAGAQKNLGPAGCTLVIIRKDFLQTASRDTITMLDYFAHAANGSRLNTPPTFAIYVMGLVFKWILDQGGLATMRTRNAEKAALLYTAIDNSGGFYRPVSKTRCRSHMNVTFRTPNEALDEAFLQEAKTHEMSGLKGHRDVGGLRASIYNAFPRAGCAALAQLMSDFAARKG
ncbi:MAG: 3-phosphoserine/phosphohydroxythreonine transaminase [Phycisphaerales bacterium]|nr:3-phosphoserine/phosphohydroxythreonine transaminase [Phycisphaerales bacterium]